MLSSSPNIVYLMYAAKPCQQASLHTCGALAAHLLCRRHTCCTEEMQASVLHTHSQQDRKDAKDWPTLQQPINAVAECTGVQLFGRMWLDILCSSCNVSCTRWA